MERSGKVCVTGGTGYIGSWLVLKLLNKGYTVHATLRDIKNESKVGLLRGLPDAETRLVLFEADIYNPNEFEPAIQGCEYVFHVATPMMHQNGSQYKDLIEAAMAGSRSIAMSCKRAGTVRRLIYTGTVLAASPLKDDGSGFKDSMDETCWTPLVDSISHKFPDDFHRNYTYSKTMTEREMFGDNEIYGGLEVVSLACGLVSGNTILSHTPGSLVVCVSQLTEHTSAFNSLKFLEEMLGKVPLVHIDDVCEAHILCMENPSINGRFLCANSYVSLEEIADYFLEHHPQFPLKQEKVHGHGQKINVKWDSTKLTDNGFVYKYDTKMILDDSIKCARRMGHL